MNFNNTHTRVHHMCASEGLKINCAT